MTPQEKSLRRAGRQELSDRAAQLLPYLDAPLISEAFDPPVRLTREAEKEETILYAVGRGDLGIIVQSCTGFVASAPRPLQSLLKHQPYLANSLDSAALASVLAETPRHLAFQTAEKGKSYCTGK